MSGGPNNWWFKIESWGSCTAATGTSFDNIRGYKAGTYNVWAYSNSDCSTQIASTTFTITAATLTTTVNNDRSVNLSLSGHNTSWWFKIGHFGACTATGGNTVSNIRGYASGTHQVTAFTNSGCNYHLATSAFTIPNATLAAAVQTDRSVDLSVTNSPANWWFKITGHGTCTAATGTSFNNIRGYAPGSYPVWSYSNSDCSHFMAAANFTMPPYAAAPASVVGYRGWQLIDVEWSAVAGATGYDVKYWHAWYGTQRAHSNITGGTETTKKARITLPANSNVGNYHVAVRAIDANGPGLWKELAAIPSISITPKASNVTAARKTNDDTTINVSWTICNVNATSCNGGTPVTGQLVNISSDGGATWERVKTLTSYTSGSTVAIASSEVTGGIVGSKSYLVEVGIETRFKTTWVRASAPVPHVYQTVSNIDNAGVSPNILNSTQRWAAPFTTGSHPAGYTLLSVVVPLSLPSGGSGTLTWTIQTATTADDPTPTDTVVATLSGSNPTSTTYSNLTQTCSTACNLEPDTTYFLVATASGTTFYWRYTGLVGTYTANPSNNGWSIGKGWYSDYSNDAWSDWGTWDDVGKMEVRFKPKPTDLPASRGVTGYRGWGFIDAEWSPVTNATSYYVRYRAAHGNHWMTRATRHTTTSIRLGGIPNYWDYIIQVQAINATGGGAWAESAPVKPVRALQTAASNVQVTRSDGALAVSWTQCDVTQVSCHGGTPITGWAISISENGGAWTRAKDLTTYTSGSAITIDSGIDNTKSYQVHVGVITRFKTVWTTASVPVSKILTVDNLADTAATLKIINHSGDWYYKALSGPDISCSTAQSGSTDSLTGLTASTAYTYIAYNDACTTEIARHTFTTKATPVSVSSLGNSRNGAQSVGDQTGSLQKAAAQFTVGGNTGGYVLSSVTIEIDNLNGNTGDMVVAIYSNDANNKPNASQITLDGSNPTGAGQYTYTCTTTQTNSCDLTASGKYHLVLAAPNATGSNSHYRWENSASGGEVTVPTNNGWSIGESFTHSSNTWSDIVQYLKFKVTATAK